MSTTYASLLNGMWAPEGSEMNARLQKLQELERMRKEREAMRKKKWGNTTATRSRLRSNPADSENKASYWEQQFGSQLSDTYGGARPKFSSSRGQDTVQDMDQMFKSVTGEFLGQPLVERSQNFKTERLGNSDSEDGLSSFRNKYGSGLRTDDRPTYSSKYSRSYSQPEMQEVDIFAGIADSVLGRTTEGPNYSLNPYEPQSYTRRRYERTNDQTVDNEGDEQIENNDIHDEETEEILVEEETEEPVYFIERLENGRGTDEYSHQYGLNQKRSVNNGLLIGTMPVVPPLKKPKSGENEIDNDTDQYYDVTQYIHPVEDILSVAKDINAAFGSRSPTKSDSDKTGLDLSFHSNGIVQDANEENISPEGNFVFSASTPVNSSTTKVSRNNAAKRKQRPSMRGKSNRVDSFKNQSVLSSEEVIVIDDSMNDNTDNTDASVVYELIEPPDYSFSEEQKELEADTDDLYTSRLSEWNIMDHTTGTLDRMQGFFSGKEVHEDPKIWRVLNGSKVQAELEASVHDSPPNKTEDGNRETKSRLSIGDRLSKLKSMTDEKQSKKLSRESESKQDDAGSRYIKTSSAKKCQSKDTEKTNEGKAITESKKSPRDLVRDVRELKKFIHENVSESPTPELETQISVEKKQTKEISTQTDNTEKVYICKHCGKSSSERKEPALNKTEGKSNKLDLRVESKNPGQNYSALEKKHLAEIKKEMKEGVKTTADTDSKKTTADSKNNTKTTSTYPSYMKSTASSSKKTTGVTEKTRKGSVPEINKLKENETQRPKSPVGFSRGGKSIVAQRAKAFDAAGSKNNTNQKTKPTLSLCRGSSVDRQKNEESAPKSARATSNILKSKSMEQMHLLSDNKEGNSKSQSNPKPVEDKVEPPAENMQTEKSVASNSQKPVGNKIEAAVENVQIEKTGDLNMPPSPGTKRTRTQMTQKLLPPALSPKPVRKIESPGIISAEPISPVLSAENSPRNKPPSGVHLVYESNKVDQIHQNKLAHMSAGPVSHSENTPPKRIDRIGQFTTLQDSPFIKNDMKRRNSLRGNKDGESVWVKTEREGSRSRDSSLRRSNTSAGERSSLTHLSWSDSGSSESLPGSVSSSKGSYSSLQRSRSDRRGSVSSITSQNSMLNLLDSKGTKTNVVTGAKETNVDEAYQEYISSKDSHDEMEDKRVSLNDSSLIDFAQKACDLLEFEPKKRDSSTDSNETDSNQKDGKIESQPIGNGTKHMKNGTIDNTNVTEEKVGKKKQKKGFFKEAPVIVPKDVHVSQTIQDSKVASQVKGQGQQEQIIQNSRVAADDEDEEELVQARTNLTDWDPTPLLADLYKVQMMPDNTVDISHRFIGMEGLMEKLPMNKKKATLLKTWKRRFFRAADGWLHYYETSNRDKPSDSLQLMGGKVEELGPRVLGVDDGRGKYLMVRVPTDQEYGQWKVALDSQTADNVKATYVTPLLESPPHPKKKVVIIDIGSSSIRAGILGEKPTLPQLFFPTIVAVNKQTGELTVGVDTYKPSVRKSSTILQPIRPTNKVDKGITRQFNMDMEVIPEIFKKVFADLKVNPKEFLIMISTPQSIGDKLKESLMKLLLDQFHLRGVCMVSQSLLALYSYNSTSGILVDIGERMEILPIYDGLLIEGGVSRQSYGGTKVQDSLYLSLLQNKYQFNTKVEKLLVRHICEEACYVAENYKEATAKCEKDPESFKTTVSFAGYNLPEGAYKSVDLDIGCFKSPEGFFNTDLWGMDYPNIHKLVYQGIQQSPMDARKHMYRSVYLSGGVTMIQGFAERLQEELKKLAPPTVTVEVHASPQRYHAAYIGACAVASMDVFEQSCVSADEWKKLGLKACRKWGTG